MDAFREAWTVFEQPSTSTVSADGHCRFFQQTPNAQVQDAEWRQFVSSIEQDEPANPAAGFDFMSSVPQTSVPTDMMNNYEIPQTEEAPVSAPHDPAASSSLPPAPYGNVFLSEDDLASGVWTYLGSDEPFAYNNLDGQGQDCEFGNDAQLGADYEVPPAQNYDQSHHSETAARHNGYDVHVPQTIATSLEGMGDAVRDDEADDDPPDPCYAKLLYRCLREAPNHMMTLKEVYEWMTFNTVKARDSSSRGWQNSVRHNLSMNAAFEKVIPQGNRTGKKVSLWRLTDDALRSGVISTTRFRKETKKKPIRRGEPAPERQRSGAKGGQATRAATRRARLTRQATSTPWSGSDQHLPTRSVPPAHLPMTPYTSAASVTPVSPALTWDSPLTNSLQPTARPVPLPYFLPPTAESPYTPWQQQHHQPPSVPQHRLPYFCGERRAVGPFPSDTAYRAGELAGGTHWIPGGYPELPSTPMLTPDMGGGTFSAGGMGEGAGMFEEELSRMSKLDLATGKSDFSCSIGATVQR